MRAARPYITPVITREYFSSFWDCPIWARAFTEETKMVLAKLSPTKAGRIKVGSGTERFGHHHNPVEYY